MLDLELDVWMEFWIYLVMSDILVLLDLIISMVVSGYDYWCDDDVVVDCCDVVVFVFDVFVVLVLVVVVFFEDFVVVVFFFVLVVFVDVVFVLEDVF
ncbi:phage tail terminator protein [Klebsiella pneumoniae]|uniref:phage tail terminator protein n=1 Tax=Klebsiella pneumoniae TaxID=573 RepID=UPI003B5CE0DB